ncbi:hypothetical protein D0Z00_001312 [Geotrichum galactomycetum]|uniref:Uncharacterized protein n=1 Tax=Geotrichum galactomycetum TaxID=27317 RepID=A0ACB6V7G7_9ASCO|nr:hypothetical protein D0Z00_001312 [Geotrichum candidum]
MFYTFRPKLSKPLNDYPDGTAPNLGGGEPAGNPLDLEALGKFLKVDKDSAKILQDRHKSVVDHLPLKYPQTLYNGTGVAIVGGAKFMPVAISGVRMLRRINQDIPVEVFVATQEEYDKDLCEKVLPSMNAKCTILEEAIGKSVFENFAIKGYQYKALALLASSFENVLLLDADNIPLRDPQLAFDSEPFKAQGYVLWPDFWARTTAPVFYDIAGVKLGERVRGDLSVDQHVPLHHLAGSMPFVSTESGQVLVSKRRHFRSLLLATYYNLYGYGVYYPLLSQGAMGEGDKETFIAAATVLNESTYYMNEGVRPGGYHGPDRFYGMTMLQGNPQDDYEKNVIGSRKSVRPLFMHNHMNKLDPMTLVTVQKDRYPGRDEDQKYRHRFFGPMKDLKGDFGDRDVEVEMWQEAAWMVCDMKVKQDISMQYWDKTYEPEQFPDVCSRIQDHIEWLKANPNCPPVLSVDDQKRYDEKVAKQAASKKEAEKKAEEEKKAKEKSDENKSDENKSDENKSDENKSDENKSDEKKSDEKKSDK